MHKRNRIIYWIATAWLSLGMVSGAIVQLLLVEKEVAFILELGYPSYFLPFLGACKILGVITLLIPGLPLLKEWAYAGFCFFIAGGIYSHIAMGNSFGEIAPLLLLLVLTAVSWYFRPPQRRLNAIHN